MNHLLHPLVPYLALTGVVVGLLLLTKPTRALLKSVLSLALTLLHWLYAMTASLLHKLGLVVLNAHLTLLRNFLPRNAVIPTVATKTTRRL